MKSMKDVGKISYRTNANTPEGGMLSHQRGMLSHQRTNANTPEGRCYHARGGCYHTRGQMLTHHRGLIKHECFFTSVVHINKICNYKQVLILCALLLRDIALMKC